MRFQNARLTVWILIALAIAWIFGVCLTVPISADGYVAPRWVKWIVTIGHILAIVALLFPIRGKPIAAWLLSILFALCATLQVAVLWFWN